MKNKILPLILFILFIAFGYREIQRSQVLVNIQPESEVILEVKKKITTFKTPARVEVRNYIKDEKHKFQSDIADIKRMKIKLDPKSSVYLELNLFVNESDADAPLIAQFLLFDMASQNLIQEENLSLNH